jgi:hypothetical protein
MRKKNETITSAIYDGELESEAPFSAEVQADLADFARVSALMAVPEDVSRPDPFFVTRFRARRDALRESMVGGMLWRRTALRLLPVAASALAATVVMLWMSSERANALGALERELAGGVGDVTFETAAVEPALRIALGEL